MTLTQLNYFVKVAQSGHLTQTAKDLLIAQPSLTQAIRKLEEELGFALFEKKGRVLFLTKEGKEFLPYAEDVIRSSDRAKQSVKSIYKRYKGNIRFAYTRPLPKSYIPNLIRTFFENHENHGINIETYSVATARIFQDLKEDQIDFGFCSQENEMEENITLIPLLEFPLRLIVGENDPLRKLDFIKPEDLLIEPGISYTRNSAMDQQICSFFTKHKINPDIRYRTSSEEIQKFVSCGLGWAFIAQSDDALDDGIYPLKMPQMDLKRSTYLAIRKDRELGNASKKFFEFVLEYNKSIKNQLVSCGKFV